MTDGNITVGREILKSRGLDFDSNFFWISIGALLGFTVAFDILFVVALTYLKGESYPSLYKEKYQTIVLILLISLIYLSEMHSEPKLSRALVSKKKLPQLKGGERSNEVELKNKSVAVDISHTSKETQNTGEKEHTLWYNLYQN
jgi:hypothetical protein